MLIPTPDFPHFYYMLGGNLGSLLYGDVSVMKMQKKTEFTTPFSCLRFSQTLNFTAIFVFRHKKAPKIVLLYSSCLAIFLEGDE